MSKSLPFNNAVVVITGSGTGIGQAIARKFAENGANVVIMGRRKEPLEKTAAILAEIMKQVGSSGKVRMFAGVDVSDEGAITQMFDTINNEFGKVDIIVNNAGVSGPVKTFPAQPYDEFKECVAIHLTGTFWTTTQALRYMKEGSKIITIATYFTEERPYEQRPYRFRTPYTAAQGAKNRLAEAFAWELASRGIRSIATNPGPVHSDRIYKTVYPKAAAEFLRIGGFPGLKPKEIEKVALKALPMLGEADELLKNAIMNVASEIIKERDSNERVEDVAKIIRDCLAKMQEIAEKIQSNTSKMIVDGQFLSQDETAEIVLNLASDEISRLVNGRVMPADRVFYPVRPLMACSVDDSKVDLNNKVAILTVSTNERAELDRVKKVANAFSSSGARCIILFSLDNEQSILSEFNEFHSHIIDLSNENTVKKIFSIASQNFGKPDIVIHFTGNHDYNKELSTLSRREWNALVDKYINIPALVCKEAINSMVSGALEEPSLYKGSKGKLLIVGPSAPVGKKIGGVIRARAEVFRGALRPLTATVNQELKEVLGSMIRLYLILTGNIEGNEPDDNKLIKTCLYLASDRSDGRTELIYYPDESQN